MNSGKIDQGKTMGEHAKSQADHQRSRRCKRFASFVIFDTEATGLKRRPRITELCLLSVQRDEILSACSKRGIPRVINKLQLCFNPESIIDIEASRVTGTLAESLSLSLSLTQHTRARTHTHTHTHKHTHTHTHTQRESAREICSVCV